MHSHKKNKINKTQIATIQAVSPFIHLCSGWVHRTCRFVPTELIRQFYIVCVGWAWRLRADKAVENPCLERRGTAGLALSFCTGASRWPGQPEGAQWKDYAALTTFPLSNKGTKHWPQQFLLYSMICLSCRQSRIYKFPLHGPEWPYTSLPPSLAKPTFAMEWE